MTCCVVGLGYIGLPTAALLASRGHHVLGVDVNPAMLDLAHRASFAEPGLREWVASAVRDGRLRTGTTVEACDAFFLCVPTPHDPDRPGADLHDVRQACVAVGGVLRRGDLVILESTVPPGTTRGVALPLLERASGLRVGRDFHLAFCPERALPGRLVEELVRNDRVVGGVCPESTRRGAALYRTLVKGEVVETDAETAELCKLMENTYVAVNVALANEFARAAETLGLDAHEAIRLANRHPRVNILRPGPGVGGHCIPVDPWFLVRAAPDATGVIREALRVNREMPARVAGAVLETLRSSGKPPSGTRATLLGVTYKADVNDCRASPAAEIGRLLEREGLTVTYHDPIATDFPRPVERDLAEAVRGADVLVLVTDHAAYGDLGARLPALAGTLAPDPSFVDGRGTLSPVPGFRWWRLGRGFLEPAPGEAGPPAIPLHPEIKKAIG